MSIEAKAAAARDVEESLFASAQSTAQRDADQQSRLQFWSRNAESHSERAQQDELENRHAALLSRIDSMEKKLNSLIISKGTPPKHPVLEFIHDENLIPFFLTVSVVASVVLILSQCERGVN